MLLRTQGHLCPCRAPAPEPMKIAEIAEIEQIPIRFLEAILNQLKGGGFVQSRRGAEGGYLLARPADKLTVGEVMRLC